MKFLNPKIHGYLDYAVILVLFIAPSLFSFAREASRTSYTLGAVYIVLSLATAYPLGLFRVIPFTVHGAIELVLSPLLIAMPWLAGFSYDSPSRVFYIIAGVALFAVWLFTDYKAADIAYHKRGIDLGKPGSPRGVTV